MLASWVVLFVCVITPALSHTYLSSVTINGNQQASCVRVTNNNPISSVNSNEMTCGFFPQASQPASSKCAIAAGSNIGLQWNHNSPSANDDIVDPSHKGPCLVYLSGDNGVSWFKIFESGYDADKQAFCVTTLIANRGYMEVTIPSDIAPGNYLMRGEVIALHEGNKLNGAQFYVACAELTISGSGTAKPAGVSFPGFYSPNDAGIHYDLYAQPMATYIVPGPAVYGSGSTGPSSAAGAGAGAGAGSTWGGFTKTQMSVAAAAAIAVVVIAVAATLAAACFMYYRKGHLFGYAYAIGKGVHRVDSSASSASSSAPSSAPATTTASFSVAQEATV